MMVEGGQAEGGDGVQTKEMRTEINGGSAQDPANFEVRQKSYIFTLKKNFLSLFSSSMYFKTQRGETSWPLRPGPGMTCRRGRSGAASWTSSSPWWVTPSAWAMSGGSPTSASETEEVSES